MPLWRSIPEILRRARLLLDHLPGHSTAPTAEIEHRAIDARGLTREDRRAGRIVEELRIGRTDQTTELERGDGQVGQAAFAPFCRAAFANETTGRRAASR
jgi:hypothetical protein